MAIQKQSYQIMGMRQDNLIGTNSSNKFAHEIMNLRLNTVGDYTTAAWTTEEGTKLKPVTWQDVEQSVLDILYNANTRGYKLIPVGQAVINDQWVVFCTQKCDNPVDVIFKFWYNAPSDDLNGTILYIGHLGFDVKSPIETLTYYENEAIQKVYWTDGKNQPRVINIANVKAHKDLDTQFDFVQEVSLNEKVSIRKDTSGAGLFPACTVKYAITYYNKYGQETNVVYDSPLYYPTMGDRACGPEELSGDSFYVKVMGIDTEHGFDYIRLYSILRTTENATPIVRIVADKAISELPTDTNGKPYALFVDTNTTGEIIDPTMLQYVGGREITAATFGVKDNTLFLGNIKLIAKSAQDLLNEAKPSTQSEDTYMDILTSNHVGFEREKTIITRKDSGDSNRNIYQYISELNEIVINGNSYNGNSHAIKIFKHREKYRFGVQFQNTKGNWSEVIHLDDVVNNVPLSTTELGNECYAAIAKFVIPDTVRRYLVSVGYVKARLVCCYPNNADREVFSQGIICPTVYNSRERENSAPYVMSSWFFRPNRSDVIGGISTSEIQSCNYGPSTYGIDKNFCTMHSPEIEFDESFRSFDFSDFKIKVLGVVPINSFYSKFYLEADTPATVYSGDRGQGFIDQAFGLDFSGSSTTMSHKLNPGYWDDNDVYEPRNGNWDNTAYRLYPFQRKGSLNNYMKNVDMKCSYYRGSSGIFDDGWDVASITVTQSSRLESKVLSHILFSANSLRSNTVTDLLQVGFTVFDSNEPIPLRLNVTLGGNKSAIYSGNVNSIAPLGDHDYEYMTKTKDEGVHITSSSIVDNVRLSGKYALYANDGSTMMGASSDPVPITFKSTKHGIFFTSAFNYIPSSMFSLTERPFMWLAELSREFNTDTETTRFGGPDNHNNIYVPCGPTVELRNSLVTGGAENEVRNVTLLGLEGDHYYMRYDCLKTYPFDPADANQIVEILSFMCETRVNLDGRYDKNRGLLDNTTISTTNFNYINASYTQSNNFFTFNTLDHLSQSLDTFNNQLTWTKTKESGEDVDTWTNITLASVADAEGTSGKINKIINLNNDLYLFQDHGIAKIGYNEKTALSVENGVPLEIANSGKYTGLSYLSKEVGCQNKWSVSSTKNGVFFIDDSRQELMMLSEGLQSLSSMHGLDAFFIQQLPDSEHFTPWTPDEPKNFVTYYDKLGNDVYYINKDYCLTWNEQSKTFTSFYSYNNVPYMANIGTHLLMWEGGNDLEFDINEETREETVTTTRTETRMVTETRTRTREVLVPSVSPEPFIDEDYLISTWRIGPYLSTTPYVLMNGVRNVRMSAAEVKRGFLRVVPYSSSGYWWHADVIVSVEFKKDGQPFIIQFKVRGTHGSSVGDNHWQSDPTPLLYFVTEGLSDIDKANLLFSIGGYNEPTLNVGNFVENPSSETRINRTSKISNNNYYTQPWNEVDDYFIEDEDYLVCKVKIYDLKKNTDDKITGFVGQNPFMTFINDNVSDFNASNYEEPEITYETQIIEEEYEETYPVTDTITETSVVEVQEYSIKSSTSNIWAARELTDTDGRTVCSNFFGNYKPYWITLACDGAGDQYAFPADKVFNVIEYRADVFNRLDSVPRPDINIPVFDSIAAYNGYQIYKEFPINSIRKFEIWRAQLPRATYMDSNHQLYTNRDRIRNPFCYIKLQNTNGTSEDFPNTSPMPNRMILHDLAVYYDMR